MNKNKYYDVEKMLPELNKPIRIILKPKGYGKKCFEELMKKKHENKNK